MVMMSWPKLLDASSVDPYRKTRNACRAERRWHCGIVRLFWLWGVAVRLGLVADLLPVMGKPANARPWMQLRKRPWILGSWDPGLN